MSLQVQKTNLKTGAALFAASRLGSSNTMGNLEEEDVANAGKPIAGMPIDDYLWILALICLIYVFMKLRTSQKNEIQI